MEILKQLVKLDALTRCRLRISNAIFELTRLGCGAAAQIYEQHLDKIGRNIPTKRNSRAYQECLLQHVLLVEQIEENCSHFPQLRTVITALHQDPAPTTVIIS